MTARSIDATERRSRLAVRHHLAAGCTDVVTAARGVVGFHSSDPASVHLEAWARVSGFGIDQLETALYEDRSLVRVLGMRRTMFVVPTDFAGVVSAASAKAIAVRERRRLVEILDGAGIGGPDPGRWIERVAAVTLEALAARGEAVASELSADVPELRQRIVFGEGKRWAGEMSVGTRMLLLLSMEGRVMRGRPRGSWISSQYRWAPTDRWLDGGIQVPSTAAGQVDLVRTWLGAFGPGTIDDLRWWTGLTLGAIRRALAEVPTTTVRLGGDGVDGLVLDGDDEPIPDPGPWVALLPALDATVMGWTGRSWYLGDHARTLFDRNGNAGPTVWADGRVVGGWGQRASGEVAVRLLEDVGVTAARAIEARAAELTSWLDPVRITPRFRTPLEVELAAS